MDGEHVGAGSTPESGGVVELVPGPRRVALVIGDAPVAEAGTVLERLGCEQVFAGAATAVETALALGSVNLVLLAPEVLASDRGLHVVEELRAAYPALRLLVIGDPGRMGADMLVRALQNGVHNVLDPVDTIGLHTSLAQCLDRSEENAERVLAIGAHPDDVEIGSAGALLEHRRRGDHLTVLTLSHGRVGGDHEQRVRESVMAAEQIGARLLLADLPDTSIDPGIETIRLLESVVAQVRPSTVYVHSRHDNHQDHRAVNTAAMSATRGVPQVFAYQSPSATNEFAPTKFVPIDAVVARKVGVLASFSSQRERPYLEPELVVAGARYWARHLAPLARYAEPFEVVRSFVPTRTLAATPIDALRPPAPIVPMPMVGPLQIEELLR